MRAGFMIVALALLAPRLACAADLGSPYAEVPTGPPPGPIVGAVPKPYLVMPATARPGPLYAPPPVPNPPPPLIAAVPIIGEYLVPSPVGPPPATVLDAYDQRYDYNQ